MKVKLSKEAIHTIAHALSDELKKDVEKFSGSSIALHDDFTTTANELIHKLVVLKDINREFVEARKELDSLI